MIDVEQEIDAKVVNSTLPACKQEQSTTNTLIINPLLNWINDYILSEEELNAISKPKWIIFNLIISGHVILIPAEPNAGKTTIMSHLSGQMVNAGFEVYYVNSDISGGDAKPYAETAKHYRFHLMLPDMKVGLSMDSVFIELEKLADSPHRLDNIVFIFDTLKKIINVINKAHAKKLFSILRKLSAKGMTTILLAHTNKYTDDNGHPIYEGTGDMRSDVDELIYLLPQKHSDGTMTVTTHPDKVRGTFEPITFNISKDRKVTQANEPIDIQAAKTVQKSLDEDQEAIDAIKSAINSGNTTQKSIIENCAQSDISERIVKKILIKYSTNNQSRHTLPALWIKTKGDKNSYIYSLT